MLVPLSDVLALPVVSAGGPEVLVGDPGSCLVRWVHSSEVYEMGPLLSGGELLLTTGLGLRGAGQAMLEAYVDALADAGAAALGLELGRSLAQVPAAIRRAAVRRGLALVVFHDVVPFEAIIEAFHDLVMDHELGMLRRGDRIWGELLSAVVERAGLQELMDRIARLAGCPAHLLALDGRCVAGSEPLRHRGEDSPAVPVSVGGSPWGSLVLAGPRTPAVVAVLDRAAVAVGLELSRSADPHDRPAQVSALLRDIVEGRLPSVGELRARCEVAGFPADPGRALVGLAVAGDRRVARHGLVEAVERATREALGPCLVGVLGEDVVAVARTPRGGDAELRARLELVEARLAGARGTAGYSVVAVGAGGAVADVAEVGASITQAQEVVSLARRLGTRRAALLARDLGIYRLLARLQGGPELSAFVRDQLGPLLDHDTAHGTELVRTLDAYLTRGLAKTETAGALGIRRQTLYNRLARIETILGGATLADHERRSALGLALYAWRLRTGLDPSRANA